MTKIGWTKSVLIFLIITIANGDQWFQQGHQERLTWQNFDSSIKKQGSFKFVKFFTRNCRYCRLLKQVEEQLREEKQWNFDFYSVDCSIHYDLCTAKASISAFPYVGIYNTYGNLHGTIGGYYPLDTMREAFNTIQAWQNAQNHPQLKVTIEDFSQQKIPDVKTTNTQKQEPEVKVQAPSAQAKEKAKVTQTSSQKVENKSIDEDNSGWSRSVSEGLKMAVILAGVIIFNKIISPYLKSQTELDDFSKPRIIEIPLQRSAPQAAKDTPSETSSLLSDSIV